MKQLSIMYKPIGFLRLFLMVLLVVTVLLYFVIPLKGDVSMPLFYTCFGLMLLSNLVYFRGKKKNNYLDFDTIFILVYCLAGFSTTFFYHDENLFRAVFLGFPVDEEYVNKGNLLSLIGLQSYMVGNMAIVKPSKTSKKPIFASTFFLIILIFIFVFIFVISGGIAYYRSEYNDDVISDGGGIAKHILLLLVTTATVLIGTEFYNKKVFLNYKISWLAFIALIFVIGLLMWIGNRTAASQILLPIVCLYSLLFKRINFKRFIFFAASGILLMWFVQRMRTSDQSLNLSNPIMLILDLTIPVRNTYTVLEYVELNGYTYGGSMVLGISGIIPFMPSLIANSFPELSSGSAEILTNYTFSNLNTPLEFQVGLGTTIIADVYLSFGLIGAVFLMYLLGFYVNKWTFEAIELDYYSLIILGAMMGNAIFLVRASYVHPVRFIVWALIIALCNRFIYQIWKR